MAVMVGWVNLCSTFQNFGTWIVIIKFLLVAYHHSHFLAATLDFTLFHNGLLGKGSAHFYSWAVLDYNIQRTLVWWTEGSYSTCHSRATSRVVLEIHSSGVWPMALWFCGLVALDLGDHENVMERYSCCALLLLHVGLQHVSIEPSTDRYSLI